DVRVTDASQNVPLALEKLKRRRVDLSRDRFEGYKAPCPIVIGFIHNAHGAAANGRVFNFIPFAHPGEWRRENVIHRKRRGNAFDSAQFLLTRAQIPLANRGPSLWGLYH